MGIAQAGRRCRWRLFCSGHRATGKGCCSHKSEDAAESDSNMLNLPLNSLRNASQPYLVVAVCDGLVPRLLAAVETSMPQL